MASGDEVDTSGRARDGIAVEELLEQHLDALHAFVRASTGRDLLLEEDSEDLVQSVCREVLDHADRFQHDGPGAFRRWLFTEARRKILSRRRHGQARRRDAGRAEVAADDPAALERLIAAYRSFTSPSHRLELADQIAQVEAALEQLPEDQRTVVLLAHLAQWSRRDIAEELDRSEGAVRTLLHRALAALAVQLSSE